MIWLITGLAYMTAYAAVALLVAGQPIVRLWLGNLGLLISPMVLIVVVLWRRRDWAGRHRVFWDGVAAGAVLWLVGQIVWAVWELSRQQAMPWLNLIIVPQLCGSLMTLLALVARPHRGQQPETQLTAILDLYVLAALAGFLYWSLILLPGMVPDRSAMALRLLAIIGPVIRVAVVAGLLMAMRAAAGTAWGVAYWRLAIGAAASFVVLTALAISNTVVDGTYRTGSPFDVGWMLPFWFAAWAAATMPASQPEPQRSIVDASRPSPPTLLFGALGAVPLIGFGGRYLLPLPDALERYREVVTALTLMLGLVMAMVRTLVDRRALRYADRQVHLLAAACEQSDELIVIVRKGAIRYANHAFRRMSGYSSAELDVLAPEKLGPEGSTDLSGRLERALQQRETTRVTTAVRRKDGSSFQADCTVAPIFDPVHEGPHIICVMRDLTEDLRLQEQLVRVERMSAIGELLSGVAHEISNPLQSVVGSIDVMLATDRHQEMRQDLERAGREAERAVRIVRNLLAFVKRSPSERVLGDLTEIVQSVVALRSYGLRTSNIDVRESYALDLPVVLANREEVQQIVLNLLVNAEESMLSANGSGVLSIRTCLSGGDAVLEVSDDGPGVAPELAGRIFEPFFTTRKVGEGSGLGLSAAFGITTAHGGLLELLPTPRGACFRMTLPGAGFPGPAHIQYN